MKILEFDEKYISELRTVFFSSIHTNARAFYDLEQLNAWAPEIYDESAWRKRLLEIRPFVAVINEGIVGYADLQPNGYIDHFFVRGGFAGKGVGTALMSKILELATSRGLRVLYSEVSLAAQDFFSKYGFKIVSRQVVSKRDVKLENAIMELTLSFTHNLKRRI